MSVDFPAPFSPMRAWISPRRRKKSTPARARTPGKPLLRCLISRMGASGMRAPGPGAGLGVRARASEPSVLAGRDDLLRDVGREGLVLGLDPLGQFLPRQVATKGLVGRRAEERGALDGAVQLAFHHGLERLLDAVDGDDEDVLARLQARFFDGLDGAQRHAVIVREHRIDLLPLGLEERLHQLLAARGRPVAVLGLDDLHPRMGRDPLVETLFSVDGGRGAGAALLLAYLHLADYGLVVPLGTLITPANTS